MNSERLITMLFDKKLSDLMSALVMDWQLKGAKLDNNTLMLLSMQYSLAGLLQSILTVTEDLKYTERISMTGITDGIAEMLEWIMDNIVLPEGGIGNGEK